MSILINKNGELRKKRVNKTVSKLSSLLPGECTRCRMIVDEILVNNSKMRRYYCKRCVNQTDRELHNELKEHSQYMSVENMVIMVNDLVKQIEDNRLFIDMKDMNNIIECYQCLTITDGPVTKNKTFGEEIKIMWDFILIWKERYCIK